MSSLSQRANAVKGGGSGGKASGSSPRPAPPQSAGERAEGAARMAHAQQRRAARADSSAGESSAAESADSGGDEDDDDDAADGVAPRSGATSGSSQARSTRPKKGKMMSVAQSLNFIQLIVFAALMFQGLTLFVTYHQLQLTQHSAGPAQAALTQLAADVAELSRQVRFIKAQQRVTVAETGGTFASEDADSAAPAGEEEYEEEEAETAAASQWEQEMQHTSEQVQELLEEEAHATEADSSEEEGSEEPSAEDSAAAAKKPADFVNPEGLDLARTDALIVRLHRQAVEHPQEREAALLALERALTQADSTTMLSLAGGNKLMTMTPEEQAQLHVFKSWTDPPEGGGDAIDAGPTYNQTTNLLRRLGQLDAQGNAKDIKVLELVPGDRTVLAARNIAQGEYFFRIPEASLLTSTIVDASPIGRELLRLGEAGLLEHEDMLALTVFILYEKLDPNSRWKSWISMLPDDYAHMPTTWDEHNELDLLEGTQTQEHAQQYQGIYRVEYLQLAQLLPARGPWNFAQFSFAQFVWARSAIASRAFGLDMYAAQGVPTADPAIEQLVEVHVTAMSPADMINHEGEPRKIDCMWGWNENTREMCFRALRPIAANAVIHTSYGERSNSDLLSHYGFTLHRDNPFNTAPACVAYMKADDAGQLDHDLFAAKYALLHQVWGTGSRERSWGEYSGCGSDGRLDPDVFPMALAEDHAGDDDAAHPPSLAVFSCLLHADLLDDSSQLCFHFARVAVASHEDFADVIGARHQADLAEREEAQRNEGEEFDERRKWGLLEAESFTYENEIEAAKYMALFSEFAMHRIVGGASSADVALLDASQAASAAGKCTGSAASNPSSWYPAGPCLTQNQWNAVVVRFGEKDVLERVVQLGLLAAEFHAAQFASVQAAVDFVQTRIIDALAPKISQQLAQSVTPNYSLQAYFLERLLPLYFAEQGWGADQAAPFDREHSHAPQGQTDAERKAESVKAQQLLAKLNAPKVAQLAAIELIEVEQFRDFGFDPAK